MPRTAAGSTSMPPYCWWRLTSCSPVHISHRMVPKAQMSAFVPHAYSQGKIMSDGTLCRPADHIQGLGLPSQEHSRYSRDGAICMASATQCNLFSSQHVSIPLQSPEHFSSLAGGTPGIHTNVQRTFMLICSGAAHSNDPELVAVASIVPTSLLRPTSAILAMPSLSIKMLGDLRSRCAIFWPCRYSRPWMISSITRIPLQRHLVDVTH